MARGRFIGLAIAGLFEACAVPWFGAGLAQSLPRAAASVPDFSGGWNTTIQLKFEAPPSGPGPVMDDPNNVHHGHVTRPDGNDIAANAWVGDISNPILKPWAAEAIKKRSEAGLDGGEQRTAMATCRPDGVPNILTRFEPVFFLQTPKLVTLIYQRDEQVRRIEHRFQFRLSHQHDL